MRKYFVIILLTALSLLSSCWWMFEESNGYPGKLTFPLEGATMIVSGESSFSNVYILEKDGSSSPREYVGENHDTLITSNGWLTVKAVDWQSGLTITAKPSVKKRKATIHCSFGPNYWEIDVVQKK